MGNAASRAVFVHVFKASPRRGSRGQGHGDVFGSYKGACYGGELLSPIFQVRRTSGITVAGCRLGLWLYVRSTDQPKFSADSLLGSTNSETHDKRGRGETEGVSSMRDYNANETIYRKGDLYKLRCELNLDRIKVACEENPATNAPIGTLALDAFPGWEALKRIERALVSKTIGRRATRPNWLGWPASALAPVAGELLLNPTRPLARGAVPAFFASAASPVPPLLLPSRRSRR
jgi:hypothetical protein